MSVWRKTLELARQGNRIPPASLEWLRARFAATEPASVDAVIQALQGSPLPPADAHLTVAMFRQAAIATTAPAVRERTDPPSGLTGPAPQPGDVLGGRFEVLGLLGQGGMGAVYRVHDRRADRPVALKRLHSAVPKEQLLKRFEREAQLTAKVQHPSLIRVHEVGSLGGDAFIVYELVDGARPLEDMLPDLPRSERLDCLDAIAGAVAALHSAGIVHRDLKPQNVLLDGEGHVRLLDLGIALDLDDQRLSRTGELIGTPSYMAPEQAVGKKDDISPATDVWALGVLLYEMLFDALPFEGANLIELLGQIARGADGLQREGEVSPALREVYRQALAPERGERFPDAQAFRKALAEARLDTGRRLRAPALALLGLALLGPPLGVLTVFALRQTPSPPPVPTPTPEPTSTALAPESEDALLRKLVDQSLRSENPNDVLTLLSTVNRALLKRPRWPLGLAARGWARCFKSPESYDSNRAELARAVALSPDSAAVLALRSLATPKPLANDALADAEAALLSDAQSDLARFARVQARVNTGDLPGAIQDLSSLVASAPDDSFYRTQRAKLHAEAGDVAACRTDLTAALDVDPGAARARLFIGFLALRENNRNAALEAFEAVIARSPWLADGWTYRARVRQLEGDVSGADSDLTQALERQPLFADALLLRGQIRLEQGDPRGSEDLRRLSDAEFAPQTSRRAARQLLRTHGDPAARAAPSDQAIRRAQAAIDQGDTEGGFELLRLGMEQGNSACAYELAVLLREGKLQGGSAQGLTAAECFRRASDAGHADAAYNLALMHTQGVGAQLDPASADRYYRLAAERGSKPAPRALAYLLAEQASLQRKPGEAQEWLQRSIDAGDKGALSTLADWLRSGRGGPRDLPRALALYRQLAGDGLGSAAYNAGIMIEDGVGCAPDPALALSYYRRAEALGAGSSATRAAADLLRQGKGSVRQDVPVAEALYRKAALQGDALSAHNLGVLLCTRHPDPKDRAEGVAFLRQAASAGNADSLVALAVVYRDGLGVKADDIAARSWLERAANAGVVEAMKDLSEWCASGRGGPVDKAAAQRWSAEVRRRGG